MEKQAVQQLPMSMPQRLYLPYGTRTWHRVLTAIGGALYLIAMVLIDVLLVSSGGLATPVQLVLMLFILVAELFALSIMLDAVIRAAYLEGTVLVGRRAFGVRRADLATAPAVRLERRLSGLRFSVYDGRRWLRVLLRPSRYRGPAVPHPLVALADAILAGPARPEPAGREAWLVAQQLRELARPQVPTR
jgi:hypothetical protein